MKFGAVPIDAAAGSILAHSMRAASPPYEGKTYLIPKGSLLSQDHIADLKAVGCRDATVAQLDADDLQEDIAAAQIAAGLVPDADAAGLRLTVAATGRVNIYAQGAGVLQIDVAAVHALNAIDPMITLATLQPLQRVQAGMMVATVKIIAYGVPQAAVAKAVQIANQALTVLPPVFATATLIETQIGASLPAAKGRQVLAARLDRLGLALSERVVVAHETAAIAKAIASASGEVIFVLTASATSDSHDTAPQALRQAGGDVIHFGMPVDPGNLLFLGAFGAHPVIGLPGCARSPALNGADWVLERVICGVPLDKASFAAMGVGGLLKEIPSRPKPRAEVG